MRILHFLNHTVPANGHVCAMVDLACTQATLGHQVSVCSGGGGFDALLAQYGIEHVIVDQERKPAILLAALGKTAAAIRRIKPDIVHAHMMTSAIIAAMLRPVLGFKLVTTVHNDFQRSAVLMGLGQRVIGVSEAVSLGMIKRGISAKKMRTVLNGTLGSPRFPPPLPAPLALQRPAILFVGGLHPRKGVDDLIKAFGIVARQCPTAHLYLIGSGPFQEAYEGLAEANVKDGVTFCGHQDDPRPYLLGGDIFVLASHAEPAGLVLSEAREAGCAVIATEVGGIPEMLDQGRAGILVPPRRPDLLAAALLPLLLDNRKLIEARANSQINIGNLSLRRVAAQTGDVYQELLGAA
jgi:glycosyltransferase involved in cell wall biosynthesis